MFTTFSAMGSVFLKPSASVATKFYDGSLNELEFFPQTANYTYDTAQAGGGSGIKADGSVMFVGRTGSSSSNLINYSYDGGLTWYAATHPASIAIGTLYFRDGGICIASGSPSAGMIPFMFDSSTSGFTSNISFSTITNGLSAGCRALAVSNNCTSTTGYAYMAYQSFFRCTLGTGLSPSSAVTTLANHGNACDMDIDPDDARYFLLSGTSVGTLSVNSPISGGKTNITTGLNSLILSVATSALITNSVIQTATGTYRITNLSYTTGAMTMTTLSNGTILPANCGAGSIANQSCKASMSLNGNVVCLIDLNNTPIGKAYLSTDGGATFVCINTVFSLNKVFVSCCVSRGGASNTTYVLLLSTTGVYRLKLADYY